MRQSLYNETLALSSRREPVLTRPDFEPCLSLTHMDRQCSRAIALHGDLCGSRRLLSLRDAQIRARVAEPEPIEAVVAGPPILQPAHLDLVVADIFRYHALSVS